MSTTKDQWEAVLQALGTTELQLAQAEADIKARSDAYADSIVAQLRGEVTEQDVRRASDAREAAERQARDLRSAIEGLRREKERLDPILASEHDQERLRDWLPRAISVSKRYARIDELSRELGAEIRAVADDQYEATRHWPFRDDKYLISDFLGGDASMGMNTRDLLFRSGVMISLGSGRSSKSMDADHPFLLMPSGSIFPTPEAFMAHDDFGGTVASRYAKEWLNHAKRVGKVPEAMIAALEKALPSTDAEPARADAKSTRKAAKAA